jgi:peptidoglycan hydrolase-like protein with peptidoglycan-binding domain
MGLRREILGVVVAAAIAVPGMAAAVHGDAKQAESQTSAVSEALIHDVQDALRELGYQLRADGSWSADTRQALLSFQRENGLTTSGAIDAETLAALHIVDQGEGARQGAQPQLGESLIQDVQQALHDHGHSISADGRWGTNTQNALQSFQEEQGLEANGELDLRTLAALDLVEQTQHASSSQQASGQTSEGAVNRVLNEVFE